MNSRIHSIWLVAANLLVLAFVILGWKLIADARLVAPAFLPGPERVGATLLGWLSSGEIWPPLLQTLLRMWGGWITAGVLGIALGAAIAMSPTARDLIQPTAEFIRPLPSSALIPPAILAFGLSDRMAIFVIALAGIWPVMLSAINGFSSLDQRLSDLARLNEMPMSRQMLTLRIPNALPDIFSGLRISLAVSLILTVVTEMIASLPGIGQQIMVASRNFRSPEIYAGVAVLGVLGFINNAVLQAVETRLLGWRQ